MSNPIDVGSVLGGRYKVTATVLTSHDHDLVLDGVDQVLNRPVSILVAGPDNTEQVAQSAREVATGERPGTVQVLDLGVTEATTYLITNHTSAADLLDLVVTSNPPYVEPFFTDTLGSEIFGQPRSSEPEPYDDEENVDAGYINYDHAHPSQIDPYRSAPGASPQPPERPASVPRRPGGSSAAGTGARESGTVGAAAAGAAAGTGAAAYGAADMIGPATRPAGTTPSANPKVSLWSEDDYASADDHGDHDQPSAPEDRTPAGKSKSGIFKRSAAPAGIGPGASATGISESDDDDDDDEREPRSMRWLVGGILAIVLIAGLIFAVSNLGSLFSPTPQANTAAPTSAAATQSASAAPTAPASSAPPAVPPAIDGVTRLGNFDFASAFDKDLVKSYDGNAASYWSDMEFATENWGGLAPGGVPLIVKLKNPATVSSVTLTQLGATGGSITVSTNDRPSLDGAKAVGTTSFTSTDLNMPLAQPVQAQYVILSINSLPKLAAPKTRYGYGLRLAEIKVQ